VKMQQLDNKTLFSNLMEFRTYGFSNDSSNSVCYYNHPQIISIVLIVSGKKPVAKPEPAAVRPLSTTTGTSEET